MANRFFVADHKIWSADLRKARTLQKKLLRRMIFNK